MKIEENYLLEKHNTFRLPVSAQWFIEYDSEEELLKILHDEYFRECRKLHIGSGSNLLFLDNYAGIILHSAINGISLVKEDEKDVLIRVGSGVLWDELVDYCVSNGWGGIENLSLIPGEIGAAAIQNIGAYGVEVKDVIETVEAFDQTTCQKRSFTNMECGYGYRTSIFKTTADNPYIVTYVTFRLSKEPALSFSYGNLREELTHYPEITLATVRQAVIATRKGKLPEPDELGNAGSFFMNPVIPKAQANELKQKYPDMPSYPASDDMIKVPAGWLIEQCGFKGKSYGTVGVHAQQALVLVNLGNANGAEIALLAEAIRNTVAQRFGIEIVPEVRYVD